MEYPMGYPISFPVNKSSADKEGRAIRCDTTNHTAELEDYGRNEEPAMTYQDH